MTELPHAALAASPSPPAGTRVWTPSRERRTASRLWAFAGAARAYGAPQCLDGDAGTLDYPALHRWSVDAPEAFWRAVWDFTGVVSEAGPAPEGAPAAVGLERMAPPDERGPRFFPAARLSYTENLLRGEDDDTVLVCWDEEGPTGSWTRGALRAEVARVAAGLEALGVTPGDRVAGVLVNGAEAVVAMLATAALGAVWTATSPDLGPDAVADRFGQTEPRVLFCQTGYRFRGRWVDLSGRAEELRSRLPSVRSAVRVPPARRPAREGDWAAFGTPGAPLRCARVPFDHPLAILYTSGTTGLPKCIVHGTGGTLLQHLKELVLHTDLRRGDRILFHTTCGWMMWNWVTSALAVGATVVTYDGAPHQVAPGAPDDAPPDILWHLAAEERLDVLGVSPRYLDIVRKAGVRPAATHRLPALRTLLSTGSPLREEHYAYVYRAVAPDAHLVSLSGGTDLISCFALGVPTAAVHAGELQGPGLGMAVEVFDDGGSPVVDQPGELVCTRPFPSMPVAFQGDPDGSRYRRAYFDRWPGVWRHGDWAEWRSQSGGLVIHGRSDTTLNPGGVRIGTAEIYRALEGLGAIESSVAVGWTGHEDGGGHEVIALFVQTDGGRALTPSVDQEIRARLRARSPFHVPRHIVAVADLPRTLTGKSSEAAVRDVIHGRRATNREALANPECLPAIRTAFEHARSSSAPTP